MAALLKKQNPIAVLLSAWWPGGRTIATPVAASCLQHMHHTCLEAHTSKQKQRANGRAEVGGQAS